MEIAPWALAAVTAGRPSADGPLTSRCDLDADDDRVLPGGAGLDARHERRAIKVARAAPASRVVGRSVVVGVAARGVEHLDHVAGDERARVLPVGDVERDLHQPLAGVTASPNVPSDSSEPCLIAISAFLPFTRVKKSVTGTGVNTTTWSRPAPAAGSRPGSASGRARCRGRPPGIPVSCRWSARATRPAPRRRGSAPPRARRAAAGAAGSGPAAGRRRPWPPAARRAARVGSSPLVVWVVMGVAPVGGRSGSPGSLSTFRRRRSSRLTPVDSLPPGRQNADGPVA